MKRTIYTVSSLLAAAAATFGFARTTLRTLNDTDFGLYDEAL